MMRNKIIGVSILVLIIFSAFIFNYMNTTAKKTKSNVVSKDNIAVTGLIGGEKQGLFDDADVQKILSSKYALSVHYNKSGSVDMVTGDTSKYDYLFPSSENELEIFKTSKGKQLVKSESMFNSPLVFYSWNDVTDALIKQGVVQKVSDSYYVADMHKILNLIQENKKWSDIGLTNLYGKVSIGCTDPTKSNSGNMFAGLLANILNNGSVVDDSTVDTVLPQVKNIISKLGYMPSTSSDIFDQYLKTGEGANPIIVGYENQIIEYSQQNPAVWNQVKDKIKIIYPTPTVWANHPLLSLNDKGSRLITALEDKDIQNIAWQKHGFRTGINSVQNDSKSLKINGIAPTIDQVIPMPKPSVMEKIINNLK